MWPAVGRMLDCVLLSYVWSIVYLKSHNILLFLCRHILSESVDILSEGTNLSKHTMIKLPSHLLFVLLTTSSSTINLISAQGGACFKDRAELKYAVDSCWEGGKGHFSDDLHGGTELENDANEADCNAVKVKYGWPIGTWYVVSIICSNSMCVYDMFLECSLIPIFTSQITTGVWRMLPIYTSYSLTK